MPQYSYAYLIGRNGQIATPNAVVDSYLNALVAQVTTVTWASTGDAGDYTVRIQSDDEGEVDETLTHTSAGGEADTDTIAGITADAASNDNLINVVVVTDDATDTNTLTFVHENRGYTVTATAVAGTGTVAEATAAGGTRVNLGTALVNGTNAGEATLPGTTATDDDVVGLSVYNTDAEINEGDPVLEDGSPAGSMLSLLVQGEAWVEVEDAVSLGPVYVRRANASGATEAVGKLRGSMDGTARVETVTPTAVNDQSYALRLDVDHEGNGDWKSYTLGALGDASATATEICNDLRTQLAAITELTGIVTGSGTATLILTGAAGIEFASVDLGPGVLTVVETTAGAFDTFRLRNARFKTTTAAGNEVARVKVNRPS
jgi:hypothetical protein